MFEYKIYYEKLNSPDSEVKRELKAFGEQGWELISVVTNHAYNSERMIIGYKYYFKRVLKVNTTVL